MRLLASLAAWSLLAFSLLLFVVQLAAQELGYLLGARHRAHMTGKAEGVGVIVGGMLGLLAFVLALTLSFSNTRFNERRAGSLAEANAINTAWLRAEAIGDPRGAAITDLLVQYTELRIDFIRAGRDPTVLNQLNQSSDAMQKKMWGYMTGIVRATPTPVAAALQGSLNDVFNASTAERFAYAFTMPPQLFWLLIGLVLLSMAALGYQLGLANASTRPLVILLTAMWTIIVVDILDLSAPRIGEFRTSTAVYQWTLQGFKAGAILDTR
jgi:hypothetical protein